MRVAEIPLIGGNGLGRARPLPDGRGCYGVHYADFSGRFCPIEGECLDLGPAEGLSLSPSGRHLLRYALDGTTCLDTETWSEIPQPHIPPWEFPYAGLAVEWLGDDLVTVRLWERSGGPLGLDPYTGIVRLVALPEGNVVTELVEPGYILSPYSSPDGRWLAVLLLDGDEAVVPVESFFPYDFGPELRLYSQEALAAAAGAMPVPAAVLRTPEGKSFSFLIFSGDGSTLALAETTVTPFTRDTPGAEPGVDFGPDGRVVVARAPAWDQAETLDLDPQGSWMPFRFSPGGAYLLVGDRVSLETALYDLEAGRIVEIPEEIDPGSLRWFSDELVAARLHDPSGWSTAAVLWDVTTGEIVRETGLAGRVFDPSPSGDYVAVIYPVKSGGAVVPFGPLAAGDWLVIQPVETPP